MLICIIENEILFFSDTDTWIFPTVEIPFCGIHYDSNLTTKLIEAVPEHSKIFLASGYFNLTEQLTDAILLSKTECNLLMAHPTVGFSVFAPFIFATRP